MDKIDIVLPWVDGNDLKWQKEKNKYSEIKDTVNTSIRFRDWENLKYVFRGIEKYMPWINKVYFITYGHLPKWLNINCDKLVVVNHKDYIPQEYLPTFNSHTIELNMHRIKDLENQFIYFNDDTFVINDLQPTDFFVDGKPCDSAIFNPIISEGYDNFAHVSANNMAVINRNFNKKEVLKGHFTNFYSLKYGTKLIRTFCLSPWSKFLGFYNAHIPNSFLKTIFNEVWEKENEILDITCKCHLRNNHTNVNQWLMRFWQFASNNFVPRNPNIGKFFEIKDDLREIKEAIKNKKYKLICLNDGENITNFNKTKEELIKILDDVLPNKSKFER